MSRRIGSTPFRDLLAHSIATDPTLRAAADALDQALGRATRAIPQVLLYARLAHDTGFVDPVPMLPPMTRLSELSGGLQELPEAALDYLAWQLHVEGYEAAVSVQAKRELISSSLLLHRRRGTPWAVRHALETALRVPTTISQWFEYEGKPYFFRVRMDVTGSPYDEASANNALRLIYDYKNVRSWLDYLETFSTHKLPVYAGLGGVSRTAASSRIWFPVPEPVSCPVRAAMVCAGLTSSSVHPVGPAPSAPRLSVRTALSCTGLIRSSVHPAGPAPRAPRMHRRMALACTGITRSSVSPMQRQPAPVALRRHAVLAAQSYTRSSVCPTN
ncbi:MAG: phage tail protein I [Desulfovibrio sp.]|nr:phage tail protein I [Desulfovibrio sp.]